MTGFASDIQLPAYNVAEVRRNFPILGRQVNGKDLVYLDNAASTHKPAIVLDTIQHYYSSDYSNIHRGVHTLSQIGTAAYEAVREKAREFIHAAETEEIIFTKGTTDGINLIASSYGKRYIGEGDEIIITEMEHHSNIVPWQLLCDERNAVLKVVPIQEDGSIRLEDLDNLASEKTRLISIVYISNSLGTVNPVKEVIDLAHSRGIHVLLDAAQAIQHMSIDVQALKADFLVFSGHKMYGPTGTGILYGRKDLLNELPPYQGGGDMIKEVSFQGTTFNDLPFKFEAGTPNIAGVIGLGAAFDYLNETGIAGIAAHEAKLLDYATRQIKSIDGIRIYGEAPNKCSVLSFLVDGLHPYDIGVILDNLGIAIRTGHHCTQPVMAHYGIPGTCRASFAMYNTLEEVDYFIEGLQRAVRMLR
jgi:cysteine desulfurase/selenocysteine lyase